MTQEIKPEIELPVAENVILNMIDLLESLGKDYKVDLIIEGLLWDDLPLGFENRVNGKLFIKKLKNGSVSLIPR